MMRASFRALARSSCFDSARRSLHVHEFQVGVEGPNEARLEGTRRGEEELTKPFETAPRDGHGRRERTTRREPS